MEGHLGSFLWDSVGQGQGSVTEQSADASLSYSDQHEEEAHSHGCFSFLATVSATWDLSSLTMDGTCTPCSGSVRS